MSLSDVLPMAPAPKSRLARYRLLSPTASVRVSPLCLGGMSFGDAWSGWMGSCDQKTVEELLDYFYDNGGNFVDTANNYQFEQSEKWIGEWMKRRGNRDEMVIATKYTINFHSGSPNRDKEVMINYQGNGSKSLHVSINASLRKLQTDYVDILYVHWFDHSASIPELMQSLNHLVAAGKVLFLGISDTPAWIVSRANEYARNHGLAQFSVYQGQWNAGLRDFEQDIIPMARAENMALIPWGVLGSGQFKTEEQRQAKAKEGGRAPEQSEHGVKISRALEAVAKKHDAKLTAVALAYVMAKTSYVFPLIGCRTLEHLKGNIEALSLNLSEEDVKEIDEAAPFTPRFPSSFLYAPGTHLQEKNLWLLGMGGTIDHVPHAPAIKPE